jgi:hypothetical protein
LVDLTIGYHDKLAAERGDGPMPDGEKLAKVTGQYEDWL